MDPFQAVEVFAAVTGVLYVALEILQKNGMWAVGILTGAACACSFAVQHVWASAGLNLYYVAMSVVGLVQWKKAGAQVAEGELHLAALSRRTAALSALLLVVGAPILIGLLRAAGDPLPALDGVATMLSVIATWWLAQSYLQQWLLWVVADLMSTTLCLLSGQYWMAGLYLAYAVAAVYGYLHWKKRGKVVN